ncbi:MAG: HlyD family efflux transporter periplasmic adaptor subunit [Pirellulaceae bacterium]
MLFGAIIPFLLVAVGVGVMIGMKRPIPGKKPPIEDNRAALLTQMLAADVQTVRALAEVSEVLEIPVSGTVVPFREIQLAAEVAGRITEKNPNTRSGNFVEEGSELYRIDPRDYELEVERVTRRLDQERASLAEQQQDIDNAMRLVEVAEQEMLLAEAEVARFERLGGNFRSEAELDSAKRARLASMNQRVTIQNQVSLLRARRTRLESAVKLAETELEQAQLNLQRTVVRAPVSGRVVTEQVEADSYVQRGTPLVTIEDTSSVEVAVNVRMDQLYWILDQQHLSSDSLVNAAQASHYQLPRNEVKVVYQLSGRESALRVEGSVGPLRRSRHRPAKPHGPNSRLGRQAGRVSDQWPTCTRIEHEWPIELGARYVRRSGH